MMIVISCFTLQSTETTDNIHYVTVLMFSDEMYADEERNKEYRHENRFLSIDCAG